MKENYIFTLDQYFKNGCAEIFPLLGFNVQTEFELITGTKRIDVVLLRKLKKSKTKNLQVFDYFLEHNLLSYKSFKDNFSLNDVLDCSIYYSSYLQKVKDAKQSNTTISLLISKKPRKFLAEYKSEIREIGKGFYELQNMLINLRVINIEEVELTGKDGIFLSAFCKDLERMNKLRKISSTGDYKKNPCQIRRTDAR